MTIFHNAQGDNLEGTAGAVPFWKTDGVSIANIYEWPQYPLNSVLTGRTVSIIYSTAEDALVYSKDGENWTTLGSATTSNDNAARAAIGWPWLPTLSIQESVGNWDDAWNENGLTMAETIGVFTAYDLINNYGDDISSQLGYLISLIGTAWPTLNAGQSLYAWMYDWQAAHPANTVKEVLDTKAPLASPALTGVPTAPTAAVGTNTTQLATTAFVLANAGSGGAGWTSPQQWYAYTTAPTEITTAPNGSYAVTLDPDLIGDGDAVYQRINNAWVTTDPGNNGILGGYITGVTNYQRQQFALDSLIDFYGSPIELNPTFDNIFQNAFATGGSGAFYYSTESSFSLFIAASTPDTQTIVDAFQPGFSIQGAVGGTSNVWNATVIRSFASSFTINGVSKSGFVVTLRLFDGTSTSRVISALTQTDAVSYSLQGDISALFAAGVFTNQDVSNKVLIKNPTNTQWIAGPSINSLAPLTSPALTGVPTAPTASVGTNTTQIATTAFVLANAVRVYRQDFTLTPSSPNPTQITITHNLGNEAVVTSLWDTTDHVQIAEPSSPSWRVVSSTANQFTLEVDLPSPPVNPVDYTMTVMG